MKRATYSLAVLALGLMPGRGTAQSPNLAVFDTKGDTVLAIRVGNSKQVDLVTGANGQGVTSYDITLFLDAARVQLTSVVSPLGSNLGVPTLVTGTDSVRITASGAGFGTSGPQPFATLTFAMAPGALTGSLISMRINQITNGASVDITPDASAGTLDVCQSLHRWGDPDDNGIINSRDALIILTGAVGLPTPGFSIANGDVDDDGEVTSRDALLILAEGIGEPTDSRVGGDIPNHCGPLLPAPSDLLYWSNGVLNRVVAGDSVPAALPLQVAGDATWPARFSPDGNMIAYTCSAANDDICVGGRDGSHLHELSPGNQACGESRPIWSPDGSKLAFIDYDCEQTTLWVVDSAGTTAGTQILAGFTLLELGGWSAADSIVFTGYQACCSRQLWVVGADGSNAHEVFTNTASQDPADPVWSPAADSIAFSNNFIGNSSIFAVARSDNLPGVRRGQIVGETDTPSWLAGGIGFRSESGTLAEVFFQQASTGRYFRVTRTTSGGGVARPTFR